MTRVRSSPPLSVQVYLAEDWRVVGGVNEGDSLSFASELLLDDLYALSGSAGQRHLALVRRPDGHYRIAESSECGNAGAALYLDCTLSLMAFGGEVSEAMVLVETDHKGHVQQIYLLPLCALTAGTEYRLVGIDTANVARTFAQMGTVSFTRGTHITLGSGQQRLIEDLAVGDVVLTRDDGVQTIRWIGQSTLRASGAFAPVRIAAGTLNNANDLLISAGHRLFVHQRSDLLGAGQAELLVRAGDLVNGSSVTVQNGGFVDYFQLLFDSHQVIYAEGIAAESMLIDARTAPLLAKGWSGHFPPNAVRQRALAGTRVGKALLSRPDAVDRLRDVARG